MHFHHSLKIIGYLFRYFGPKWLAYRFSYGIRLRSGLIRRQIPVSAWEAQPLKDFLSDPCLAEPDAYLNFRRKHAPPFFFKPSDRSNYLSYFSDWDKEPNNPLFLANEISQGKLRYFEHIVIKTGLPPDWHRNGLTGEIAPANLHWSEIPDFGFGDIKVIWEPSRFGFVYALVRSYWRTRDERYAELFWYLVEDWRKHNSPQLGPNWKCGQEITFRIMAWLFGLYGFLTASATTGKRVMPLAQMIAVSCHRIEANLGYALSQRNNHGISEGLGLWTVGLLFPEFRRAEAWREKGRQVLETLGRDLIYDDGSFVQHSVNYHRLMLHDYIWAIRLGDLNQQPLSKFLRGRVAKAGEFLYQIQDMETGYVPNYGQNDGALILPLNNCDYQDFRPVVQASYYLIHKRKIFESGPWDEDLFWLFGPEALDAPVDEVPQNDFQAEVGGYYTFRSEDGFVFVRCATYKDRPGQADMLHTDIWWQGQNIAIDAGTYSYNAEFPWNNPLAHTQYHNTVTVDARDQMERAGRFLWLPWLRGNVRVKVRSAEGHLSYWEGEHNGYQRLLDPVTHRRGILKMPEELWLVVDDLRGRKEHNYRLHWLFSDWPYEWQAEDALLKLNTQKGTYHVSFLSNVPENEFTFYRGDEASPKGWQAPCYMTRIPALSFSMAAKSDSVRFFTVFSPKSFSVNLFEEKLELTTKEFKLFVDLENRDGNSIIASAHISGIVNGKLVIN